MAYVESSFPHSYRSNENASAREAFSLERVNRIAFVDASIFNGSKASVQISSNFCSISSNLFLTRDVSFRSVGEKRNELPDFFPKAHVMEQVNRIVFVDASISNTYREPDTFSSNYYSISSNCLYPLLRI